jgi:hypothetical protein
LAAKALALKFPVRYLPLTAEQFCGEGAAESQTPSFLLILLQGSSLGLDLSRISPVSLSIGLPVGLIHSFFDYIVVKGDEQAGRGQPGDFRLKWLIAKNICLECSSLFRVLLPK